MADKSIVSIVQREVGGTPAEYSPGDIKTIREMIEEAVGLIGGFDKIVSRGDKVLVKPNIVTAMGSSDWFPQYRGLVPTDWRVVEALVNVLKDKGCEVFVGEGASVLVGSVRRGFDMTGIGEAVERAGGKVLCLDEMPYVQVDVPDGMVWRRMHVSKVLSDVDAVISVPKMKTHLLTQATLGIKNLFGMMRTEDKARQHREDLHLTLVDVLRAVKSKVKLTIIDGILAGEGQGPLWIDPVEMNLIIASRDVVAIDAVASAVMGIHPFEVTSTRLAHVDGLGIGDLDSIDVKGKKIEEVRRPFRRAEYSPIGFSRKIRTYAGGACIGCNIVTRTSLDRLRVEGIADKIGKTDIIMGINPVIPEKSDARVIVIGDCAKEHAHLGVFLAGCPPLPSTRIQAVLKGLPEEKKDLL